MSLSAPPKRSVDSQGWRTWGSEDWRGCSSHSSIGAAPFHVTPARKRWYSRSTHHIHRHCWRNIFLIHMKALMGSVDWTKTMTFFWAFFVAFYRVSEVAGSSILSLIPGRILKAGTHLWFLICWYPCTYLISGERFVYLLIILEKLTVSYIER